MWDWTKRKLTYAGTLQEMDLGSAQAALPTNKYIRGFSAYLTATTL